MRTPPTPSEAPPALAATVEPTSPSGRDGLSSVLERDLVPGDRVGEYTVEQEIGRGAFGVVYRGVHPLIGKQVAIKLLSRRFSVDPAIVSRFVTEARVVNKIRHPNIIDIFAFGQVDDGRHFHVMELLDGEPLDHWLTTRGRLSPYDILTVLGPIAEALDAAHDKGVIHRDLKPENVFLVRRPDGGWTPKLLDFGIAKLLDEDLPRDHRTQTGMAVGTPYYMSPEQCRGHEVDRRSDVYAFGVMIFQLLTSEVPFPGKSTVDILVKHIHEPPPRASGIVPSLPRSVDDAILKMMAKSPSDRPSGVGEALALFEAAVRAPGGASTFNEFSAARESELRHRDLEDFPAPPFESAGRDQVSTDFVPASSGTLPAPVEPAPMVRLRVVFGLAALGALALGAAGLIGVLASGDLASSSPPPAAVLPPAAAVAPLPPALPAPRPADPVRITIHGPAGAEVLGPDGRRYATLPEPVDLPSGEVPISLTIRLGGFVPKNLSVVPSHPQSMSVELAPAPKARGKIRRGRQTQHADDLEPWN